MNHKSNGIHDDEDVDKRKNVHDQNLGGGCPDLPFPGVTWAE